MRKALFASLLVCLGLSGWLFATESVTQALTHSGRAPNDVVVITFTWTSAANGSVTATAINAANMTEILGLYLSEVRTNPGTTAPTDNYDITITDANGIDLMGDACLNRDETLSEFARPLVASPAVISTLTLNITGNSVDSATGTVELVFTRTQSAGTGTSLTLDPTGLATSVLQGAGLPDALGSNGGVKVDLVGGIVVDSVEGAAAGTTPALLGAQAALVEATAVDAGDAIKARSNVAGVILTQPLAQGGDSWEFTTVTGGVLNTTWTTIKAGEANYYLVVTYIKVINGDATVGTNVSIYQDDDGDIGDSTLKDEGYAASLGGGWSSGNGGGILFSTGTAGEGLYFVCGTTSSETHVTVRGYRTKIRPTITP